MVRTFLAKSKLGWPSGKTALCAIFDTALAAAPAACGKERNNSWHGFHPRLVVREDVLVGHSGDVVGDDEIGRAHV